MNVSSLFQLRTLIAPREKKAPHLRDLHVEVEGSWLRDVFEGARVRYDLIGFGLLAGDGKER